MWRRELAEDLVRSPPTSSSSPRRKSVAVMLDLLERARLRDD